MRIESISAAAIACAALTGCGYVGEPLYPALNIPTRISDLSAVERGNKIDVAFTIPPLTTEGLAVKTIGSIDLRVGPKSGTNGFQAEQWAAFAKRIDLPAPEHPGLVRAEIPIQEFLGQEVIVSVRVGNAKGRVSEWSNLAVVSVQAPLATPANFRLTPVAEGVRLDWDAPNQPRFRVYRRAGQESSPAELATVEKPEYIDTTTEYGKTYAYYVQGVNGTTESEVAGPEIIQPHDTFPPATPAGVTASAGINSIELAWERNTEPDFKEYRVLRSTEAGPFEKIADSIEAPNYSDSRIESGKHYRYQIVAVDQAGNPSKPSEPVEATAP